MTLEERLKAKVEKERLESSPAEKLETIIDKTIEEVENLKEDEEIYPEIKKTIEKEIPEEVKKEFDNLAKSLENKKTMTEKENIIYEVRELRNDIDVLNRRITRRQTEDMDIMKMIFDRLRFLKRHVSKWFIGMLLITFVSGGIIFTSTYHNWDTIAPQIDKLVNLVKIGNSITRTGG